MTNEKPLFGGLRVRLEPWEIDYGSELPVDTEVIESAEQVVLDVEQPAAGWDAVDVPPGGYPGTVYFVDGVRRVETRLVVTRDDRLLHGALGSFGVGAVRVQEGAASWFAERIGRVVVLGGGELLPAPWTLADALVYRPVTTAEADADAPLLAIHREMRMAEEALARELAQEAEALVIADGPLTFGDAARSQTVGFIKRLFKLYLPPPQLAVVRRLAVGQRSPVFAIRGAGRFARYSWFVRLANPSRVDGDLTGLARLEVSEAVGLEAAMRLAGQATSLLPAFVPSRGRDPRAPQNLLPIGALESRLRRRLGDTRLIRRRVAALIASESVHD